MIPIVKNMLLTPRDIIKDGLVACYKFAESGQVLTDYSPYGNHGQLGSASSADTNDPTWTAQGLSFGGDDKVLIAHNASIAFASTFTVGAVFKFTHSSTIQTIVSKIGWVSWYKGWALVINSSDKLVVTTGDGTTGGFTQTYETALIPGLYYLVEVSRGNTNTILRVNGGHVGSWVNGEYADSGSYLRFGTYDIENYLVNGEINYSYLSNVQLSLTEHIRNYKAIKTELAKRGVVLAA